jgi:hypothetical protein
VDAPWMHRLKHRVAVASAKRREVQIVRRARVIVTNPELTRRHRIECLGLYEKNIRRYTARKPSRACSGKPSRADLRPGNS